MKFTEGCEAPSVILGLGTELHFGTWIHSTWRVSFSGCFKSRKGHDGLDQLQKWIQFQVSRPYQLLLGLVKEQLVHNIHSIGASVCRPWQGVSRQRHEKGRLPNTTECPIQAVGGLFLPQIGSAKSLDVREAKKNVWQKTRDIQLWLVWLLMLLQTVCWR